MNYFTHTQSPTQYDPQGTTAPCDGLPDRWRNAGARELADEFESSTCNGRVVFTENPAKVKNGRLSSLEVFQLIHPDGRVSKFVKLTVLRSFKSKHHGLLDDYHILAHAIVHAERGTECNAKDPQFWNAECKAVEYESSKRLGFCDFTCRTWDPETESWLDYRPAS